VIVRLGTRGVISQVELDTSHFKGNFPDAAALEGCDAPAAELESLTDPKREWTTILPETPLKAHTRHRFEKELAPAGAVTHVRLRNFPDGGISRMRLHGTPALPAALTALNEESPEEAAAELLRCCGSVRWAAGVAALRPFASHLDLFAGAEQLLDTLTREDWLEAFAAHPRIGDRAALAARFGSTRAWAEGEQASALTAPDALLDELAAGNAAYEKRFGHVFLICATGLPAFRMLASLKERMTNPHDIELATAADEQRRITRLRLARLLA
ncbi:MAG: 2-oxo-4-hydroxy-4-carboxy-5-ureidoimidazoline decarboxylase, partial [Thermoanaerobaculia bacterium]